LLILADISKDYSEFGLMNLLVYVLHDIFMAVFEGEPIHILKWGNSRTSNWPESLEK
jgi:hypothetical protein